MCHREREGERGSKIDRLAKQKQRDPREKVIKRQTEIHRHRYCQRQRQTETYILTETERRRDRQRQKQRDGQRKIEKDRKKMLIRTDRQRKTETNRC